MILIKKLQKLSALPSSKMNKNEHLMGEEILPSKQNRILEQFIYLFTT